ncbi:ectoine/hydroxyectoine ABC transporter substrate-binding protein EhuB [Chloroflexota bacterium]
MKKKEEESRSDMKIKALYIVFIIIIAAVSSALSCSPAKMTTLEQAKKEGTLRIGFANDVPYGYVDSKGKVTGEAPEIARKVLAEMGINNIEGVYTEFGSLIQGLMTGRFDIIAAGMFITPKRFELINYSEPTYRVGQAFMVKAGNLKNLHSYEDVANNPDVVLAVMTGAVEGDYARAIGVQESQLLIVPDPPTGMVAVENREADALALTSLAINKLVKTNEQHTVEMAQPFANPVINGKEILGYGGFGFRKEDAAFLEEFNKHLKAFIGTEEHLEIMNQFGFTELPGDITAKDLCQEQ